MLVDQNKNTIPSLSPRRKCKTKEKYYLQVNQPQNMAPYRSLYIPYITLFVAVWWKCSQQLCFIDRIAVSIFVVVLQICLTLTNTENLRRVGLSSVSKQIMIRLPLSLEIFSIYISVETQKWPFLNLFQE